MARFVGRRGDLVWGTYDYPVTLSQKTTLDGLKYMMRGLPRAKAWDEGIPEEYFCSQRPDNGDVVIGLHHNSVNVHRNGRITSNERRADGSLKCVAS